MRLPTRPVLLPLVGLALAVTPLAGAAPVRVLLSGELDQSLTLPDATAADSFGLRLTYDDPAIAPGLSSFSTNAFTYLADRWQLDLFDAEGGVAGSFNADTDLGLTGFLHILQEGGDPLGLTDRADATVGLYDGLPESLEADAATRLEAAFTQPSVFPPTADTDPLPPLPDELTFVEGRLSGFGTDADLPIAAAQVSTALLVTPTPGLDNDNGDEGSGDQPAAIPNPTAAVSGLLLLAATIIARRR